MKKKEYNIIEDVFTKTYNVYTANGAGKGKPKAKFYNIKDAKNFINTKNKKT